MPMPWRMAACRIGSPSLALKLRPLGCAVIWKGPAVIFGYPRADIAVVHPILPSNQSPLGALPGRFRRERLLVVGCGDVGLRLVRALNGRVRILALTSSPQRVH